MLQSLITDAESSRGDPKMVTGLFRDSESVERAYQVVAQRGYDTGDINVVMSDDTRKRYFSGDRQIDTELGSKAAEGGELGGPIGGTIGTLIPALVAAGGFIGSSRLGFGRRWARSRSTGRRWRRWAGVWPYCSV